MFFYSFYSLREVLTSRDAGEIAVTQLCGALARSYVIAKSLVCAFKWVNFQYLTWQPSGSSPRSDPGATPSIKDNDRLNIGNFKFSFSYMRTYRITNVYCTRPLGII